MPSLFYTSWSRCDSSNVGPCGAREDRYGNQLSPWVMESTAEPGEGTRDYPKPKGIVALLTTYPALRTGL